MLQEYVDKVNEIKEMIGEFIDYAEAGVEGYGCKQSSLKARKFSTAIGKELGAFRKLSIQNDKTQPTQKHKK